MICRSSMRDAGWRSPRDLTKKDSDAFAIFIEAAEDFAAAKARTTGASTARAALAEAHAGIGAIAREAESYNLISAARRLQFCKGCNRRFDRISLSTLTDRVPGCKAGFGHVAATPFSFAAAGVRAIRRP